MSEHINPTKVVYNAVLIPTAINPNAFCKEAELDTSILEKAVPNIKRNPVTVPTIPSAKQDSAINQPTLVLCS